MKSKEVIIEYSEADVAEMRANGIDEDAIPTVGKHVFKRGGFRDRFPDQNKTKSKARINIYVDLDVLEHFRKRAEGANAAPYQTQMNAELRKAMARDLATEKSEIDETVRQLLANDDFLVSLSRKLKEKELETA